MKLEKLALVAEIVSALAVVLTLIILIASIRENTEISRVAAYQSTIERFNSWRGEVSSDYQKADLFRQFIIQGDVPADGTTERLILNLILDSLMNNYESAYFAYGNGLIDEEEWDRIERTACSAMADIWGSPMEESIGFRLSEEFKNYLEDVC